MTGVKLLELTSQVIVCEVPACQLVPVVLDVVTLNGPAVPFTVTIISSWLLPPHETWLSLTKHLKFSVLATDGSTSHFVVLAPDKIYCN